MPRFKFRLEAILKLRKMRQEQHERHVAQRVTHLLHVQDQLQALNQQIEQLYDNIRRTSSAGPLNVEHLIGGRRFLNHLHHMRYTELSALAEATRRLDHAKKDLTEAKKQTDVMEKLKGRARDRFHEELRRKETVALDDLANVKYAWQRQSADEERAA